MTVRIGIDTGGTFTDVVRWTRAGVTVHKLPSTPDDPARAVLAGIAAVRAASEERVDVVHGTTIGLNAVLQGRVPRTVFVTNRGFVDLIEIGRQERTDLYALEPDRPVPPVPRALRVEVDCRRGPAGEVDRALTVAAITATVARVRRLRPQAIAIGLLHSPAAPADERRLAAALRRALPTVPITCSAALWPAFAEYERFSAAILNAAIAPLVNTYTSRIQRGLGDGQLRLLRSSMGILPPAEALAFPARAMFSGPAGGVLATERLAAAVGWSRAAAFDMGGTSTDVCLVQRDRDRGASLWTDQGSIAGLPLPLPTVDVHTVGCGGGSIAFADAGGALRVGPESAGARPGPACYGIGDEPTVTDAHVALGHLGRDTLLGGGFPIDPERSVAAIERLGKKLGFSTARTARGILAIADVTMARALLRITGERGVDPATVPLVAYGGAGGLHAAGLAERLGMSSACIPIHAGAFSALGLALAGDSLERSEPVRTVWTVASERRVRARARVLLAEMVAQVRSSAAGGVSPTRAAIRTVVTAHLRFRGQGMRLAIAVDRTNLADAFRRRHQQRFGFTADAPVEIVELAVRVDRPGPAFPQSAPPLQPRSPVPARRRPPVGGSDIRVFSRNLLTRNTTLAGPCVIEEATAATWLPRSWTARVEPTGLILQRSTH